TPRPRPAPSPRRRRAARSPGRRARRGRRRRRRAPPRRRPTPRRRRAAARDGREPLLLPPRARPAPTGSSSGPRWSRRRRGPRAPRTASGAEQLLHPLDEGLGQRRPAVVAARALELFQELALTRAELGGHFDDHLVHGVAVPATPEPRHA